MGRSGYLLSNFGKGTYWGLTLGSLSTANFKNVAIIFIQKLPHKIDSSATVKWMKLRDYNASFFTQKVK